MLAPAPSLEVGLRLLPRIRLHDLRYTSASLLLASGVNAKVVSERLGHSSISVTMDLYSHVAPGIQEDAAERLERAIEVDPGDAAVVTHLDCAAWYAASPTGSGVTPSDRALARFSLSSRRSSRSSTACRISSTRLFHGWGPR
jgi:hypothetical protein